MNQQARKNRNGRMTMLSVIFCLCLVYLFGVVCYYKFYKREEFEIMAVSQIAANQSGAVKETNPNRGSILDRNKRPLAISSKVYNVVLDVSVLNTVESGEDSDGNVIDPKADTLLTLSEALNIPIENLEALFKAKPNGELEHPTNWEILARQVSAQTALALKDLPHVYLEEDTQRKYMEPMLAPQTVGFLRGPSAWGIEEQYYDELAGEQGRSYRAFGTDGSASDVPAKDGYSVITTLDAELNSIAQRIVNETAEEIPCEFAGMLIMQPYTGEVLAMAQWPSFSLAEPANPEYFTDTTVKNVWDDLDSGAQLEEMFRMWRNYHTTRSFEPGSIFKPIVVAAAIEEGLIDIENDTFFCGGAIDIYGTSIPCWIGGHGHGGQYVNEVLMNSCNVGMIKIVNLLGRDLFYKYRNDFGYADYTGIDLPGEMDVSSDLVMYGLSELSNPVNIATSGMGQGFNNTAIQAITAFSAVINGGNVMEPYVVSQVADENGNIVEEHAPTVVRKVISQETSDYMREQMRYVVESGTGKGAFIEGYTIGGKTGSGQQDENRDGMTLSFVAYTPVENPEYIILAVLDHVADTELSGGNSVAPMVKKAIESIIEYKNLRPTSGDDAAANAGEDDDRFMKDYSGLPVTDVIHNLNNLGIDYNVVGSGTTVSHTAPAANAVAPKNNGVVYIYFEEEESVSEVDMTIIPDVKDLTMEQAVKYVEDAGLIPIPAPDGAEEGTTVTDGIPVTYYAGHAPSDIAGDEPAAESGTDGGASADEPRLVVYKQSPSPEAVVPRGTEVKLRGKLQG